MPHAPIAINLGELPRGEQPGIEAPWPGWWRRSRPATGTWRWLPAAGAVALLLITTAAAAAPARPWAVLLFTVPASDRVELGPEHLYVISEPEDEPLSFTAYRLADGEAVWEAHPGEDGWFTVQYGIPTYISTRFDEVVTGDDSYHYTVSTTTGFDPETGEPRWTYEGFPTVMNDEVMVFEQQTQESPARFALAAVDLATGRERWTLPFARLWGYARGQSDQARQLVSLTRGPGDWRLTSYDLETGDRIATATVEFAAGTEEISVVGSQVLLHSIRPPRLSAYDLATLRHQWTTDLPAESWLVVGCGEALCAHGGVPYALDPATGEPAWSADWLAPDLPSDGDWVLEATWSQDYLLAGDWLVDAATGEPRLELTEWEPLFSTGGWALPGGSDGLLTRQATSDDPASWRTWFGRLRTDPMRIELLGAVDRRQHDCRPAPPYLACRAGDELRVWRISELARTDTVG